MKKLGGMLLVTMLVAARAGNAGAKATTVFEDPVGDAGLSSQSQPVPGADQAGFDIVSGSIEKVKSDLNFTVTHAAMPPSGALPEGFRLMWHFSVDGKQYRFTIKSADIGKPDPLSGPNGQERLGQLYLEGAFRLETFEDGQTVGTLTMPVYTVVAMLDGVFDPAAGTVTVTLPMKVVKAKKGSAIAGGTGGASDTSCQICWVPHYAERSLTPHTVIDYATQTTTYKVR